MNLPTEYQSFIHLSRYARWRYDEERRERWSETIGRFFDFFKEDLKEKYSYELVDDTANVATRIQELLRKKRRDPPHRLEDGRLAL